MSVKPRLFPYLAGLLLAAVFAVTPFAVLATAASPGAACAQGTASESEVGPLMQGICKECYKLGDCSVTDIMSVFANVGNYVVGIIASLVFLMYVLGGMFWLGSRGDKAWVDKGKKYIRNSTIGLLIVLFAYAGITTLKLALESGKVGGSEIVICDGTKVTEGKTCGDYKQCSEGQCLGLCELTKAGKICWDTSYYPGATQCENGKNLCSGGGEDIQCCYPPGYLGERTAQ